MGIFDKLGRMIGRRGKEEGLNAQDPPDNPPEASEEERYGLRRDADGGDLPTPPPGARIPVLPEEEAEEEAPPRPSGLFAHVRRLFSRNAAREQEDADAPTAPEDGEPRGEGTRGAREDAQAADAPRDAAPHEADAESGGVKPREGHPQRPAGHGGESPGAVGSENVSRPEASAPDGVPMPRPMEDTPPAPGLFLRRYFGALAGLCAFAICVVIPYSAWWLHASGDVAVERAVAAQAGGEFALFGSGVSQDFVDYKLRLYEAVRPEVIAIGSSRVMQFRGAYFSRRYLNMGGVAGNLPVLRSTLDALLNVHRPEAVIIGLDFWWFMPQWNPDPFKEEPPTSGSYNYGLESLKKPWAWLLDGKISLAELAAPLAGIFGRGFRDDRYGIMAQQTDDGFGPDGSWYYTADVTGRKKPFDFQFRDTLTQVAAGFKAFYRVPGGQAGPSAEHLDAFAEIWCKLRSRGIKTFVFIAPLSERVLAAMREKPGDYPHLFELAGALKARGIDVMDFTDPRSLGSNDCEFLDGFHGGEVTYARVLRRLADRWSALLPYVDMEKINVSLREWKGHAIVRDTRLTDLWETDFMEFGCVKRGPGAEGKPENQR